MNAATEIANPAIDAAADVITGLSQREQDYVLGWLLIHHPSELAAACDAARASTAKRAARANADAK